MDSDTFWVTVAGQAVGALSAWAGAHKGVAELGSKVVALTQRVGQLEVVVGLRGALRSKDAVSPYPAALAALIAAENGQRPAPPDTDPTPPDGIPQP